MGVVPAISFAENIDSPRKQMANGIAAENVVCKSNFTLMIRSSGDAACVTPTTAEKLENAGWGTIAEEKMIEASMEEEISIEESIEEVDDEEVEGQEHSVELEESIGMKSN